MQPRRSEPHSRFDPRLVDELHVCAEDILTRLCCECSVATCKYQREGATMMIELLLFAGTQAANLSMATRSLRTMMMIQLLFARTRATKLGMTTRTLHTIASLNLKSERTHVHQVACLTVPDQHVEIFITCADSLSFAFPTALTTRGNVGDVVKMLWTSAMVALTVPTIFLTPFDRQV